MNIIKLNNEEYIRYSRQLSLPGFGLLAQLKVKEARVLVVGAGGLGVPVLQYLVAAGVGTIGVIDPDTVDLSNLHRQVIYQEEDVGKLKVSVTKERLKGNNPNVDIRIYPVRLMTDNAAALFTEYDIVVDGTDNLPTRYLINDQAVAQEIPVVYGAIFRYEGQVSVLNYELSSGHRSPNYRDLFPEHVNDRSIPNCAETGVIGVLPGIIGSLQAMEVIKLITGVGEPLAGKLMIVDTLTGVTSILKYNSRRNVASIDKDQQVKSSVGDTLNRACENKTINNTTQIREITMDEVRQWRKEGKEFQLVDIREPYEPEDEQLHGQRIPMYELFASPENLSHNKPVILYCQHGQRSAQAVRYLQKNHQFTDVYSLKGGVVLST